MTRKELIEFCVDDQIKRGIVKPENRKMQINARLKGFAGIKAMTKADCVSWYKSITENKK